MAESLTASQFSGRVEETTILFRLRHTVFQGFPVGGSLPYALQDVGLPPRQTGRAAFPHPAFTATLASGTHRQLRGHRAQRSQPQLLEMHVGADMLRRTVTPLAASLQVLLETDMYLMIDLLESHARIAEAKVVGPASQVLVQFLNQHRDRQVTPMTAGHLLQLLPFPFQALGRRKHVSDSVGPGETGFGQTGT
jgi:hypothetical protein